MTLDELIEQLQTLKQNGTPGDTIVEVWASTYESSGGGEITEVEARRSPGYLLPVVRLTHEDYD